MKYDIKNKRYQIGLGLWFSFTNNHIDYKGQWICRSNIDRLNFRPLEAITEPKMILEITGIIQTSLNFVME